ncbi:hypothetical protein LMG31506_01791 [Cupriavidus yeoncheonensis]|uniref:Uncharacterized protein n=1 Tax=Cupriavidus yeoncheonensis TaxID=1462994 RepID=A0A916ISK3_9BURK|nr:hypothetical protein LMG31506_01791 [Cupriavidus yeoncheonensis]
MPARCGVRRTCGCFRNALSGGSGSVSKTSRTAPPSHPLSRAEIISASLITAPRDTLTSTSPFFACESTLALIMPRVFGVNGQQRTRKSETEISSSTDMYGTCPGNRAGVLVLTRTSIPKPSRAISQTRFPICPNPMMPSDLPRSSTDLLLAEALMERHFSFLTSLSKSASRRLIASMPAMANSATELAFPPGMLATGIPRCVALSTGMMSTPAPCLTTARRRFASSNMSFGNLRRTIIASARCMSTRSALSASTGDRFWGTSSTCACSWSKACASG